jgi:hypothetical protein
MFLVELRPGREELYRTSDELALAIRNGDVDARSRIYHRATAKWISITLHPQYKAIVSAPIEESVARPVRKGWTFLGGITPAAEFATEEVSHGQPLHRYRRPLALGISGVLLMLGVQLAFSGPRPPWAGRNRAVVVRHPRPARAPEPVGASPVVASKEELVSLASTTTVWPRDPQPIRDSVMVAPPAEKKAPLLPRAPNLHGQALGDALPPPSPTVSAEANSVEGMLARYAAAHDAARARLEGGMRVARLARLFAASRLSPDGGVTDTRMSLAGASNFIHVFRQQQNAIEAAYQDSVPRLAKQFGWSPQEVKLWYGRPDQTEDPTLKLVSGSLLGAIDSMLGVLDAQAGAYKITGSAIAFEDPMAAKTYGILRRLIKEQIDSAIAAEGATSAGPTALLLQAIGTTTLPRET